MIKKIKDRINVYVDGKFKQLFNKQRKISQIQLNYAQLNHLFSDSSFYMPLTGWSMSPSTITHVLNDIVINDRHCIIEFGSGASTFYIAKLLKLNKIDASFFTVESNTEWIEKIKRQLEILGLTDYVTIIMAPIESIDEKLRLEEQELWYDIARLNEYLIEINDIDLVLVDGPGRGITPNARFSAVPYLKDKLAEKYSVFLDDIHREEEKNIIKRWSELLGSSVQITERYGVISSKTNYFSKPFQL